MVPFYESQFRLNLDFNQDGFDQSIRCPQGFIDVENDPEIISFEIHQDKGLIVFLEGNLADSVYFIGLSRVCEGASFISCQSIRSVDHNPNLDDHLLHFNLTPGVYYLMFYKLQEERAEPVNVHLYFKNEPVAPRD